MDYSRYHYLSAERKDKILSVAFNRPDSLNAINAGLHTELSQIFADIAQDQETEVVVLTGKGRAFCAGGDIKWFQDMSGPQLDALFTEAPQDHNRHAGSRAADYCSCEWSGDWLRGDPGTLL